MRKLNTCSLFFIAVRHVVITSPDVKCKLEPGMWNKGTSDEDQSALIPYGGLLSSFFTLLLKDPIS